MNIYEEKALRPNFNHNELKTLPIDSINRKWDCKIIKMRLSKNTLLVFKEWLLRREITVSIGYAYFTWIKNISFSFIWSFLSEPPFCLNVLSILVYDEIHSFNLSKMQHEILIQVTEPPDEGERGEWKSWHGLNIQKTKIMASGSITSWQIEWEKVEAVTDFFLGLQNHCTG